ncbi:MAG: hypothetical protein ACI81R_001958 [Bradymonadia bacterium]|jgi:hypothetical protein
MTESSTPSSLENARLWIVTDGSAEAGGWLESLTDALRAAGASSVDVFGVSGMLGITARGLLETGAEKIARTLRLSRRGEPDATAFDALAGARPDLVITDHPDVLRTLEVIRDTVRLQSFHVALVHELVPNDAWHGARADGWVVPTSTHMLRLRKPAQSDLAFEVTAAPVPPGFERALKPQLLRESLGLPSEGTLVLVDTADMEIASLDAVVFQLSLTAGVTPIFYYGRAHEAAEALRRMTIVHGVQALMLGHTSALEEVAACCAAAVTGIGSSAVANYVALGVPTLSLDPAAVALPREETLCLRPVPDVSRLSAAMTDVVEAGRVDGVSFSVEQKPSTAQGVAAAMVALYGRRVQLKTPVALTPPPPGATNTGDAGARFETIGGSGGAGAPLSPLTKASAKEQLATLILDERKLEQAMSTSARERDKWMGRHALAGEESDPELAKISGETLDRVAAQLSEIGTKLDDVRAQKDIVRRRAALGADGSAPTTPPQNSQTAAAPDAEARFRALERKRDLDRLRKRADDSE